MLTEGKVLEYHGTHGRNLNFEGVDQSQRQVTRHAPTCAKIPPIQASKLSASLLAVLLNSRKYVYAACPRAAWDSHNSLLIADPGPEWVNFAPGKNLLSSSSHKATASHPNVSNKEALRGHCHLKFLAIFYQKIFSFDVKPSIPSACESRNTRYCTAMLLRKDILVWLNLKCYVTCRGFLYTAATLMPDSQDSWLLDLSFGHIGGRLLKLGFISYRKEANQTGFIYRMLVGRRMRQWIAGSRYSQPHQTFDRLSENQNGNY